MWKTLLWKLYTWREKASIYLFGCSSVGNLCRWQWQPCVWLRRAFVYGHVASRSLTRNRTRALHWECGVLATEPPGRFLVSEILNTCFLIQLTSNLDHCCELIFKNCLMERKHEHHLDSFPAGVRWVTPKSRSPPAFFIRPCSSAGILCWAAAAAPWPPWWWQVQHRDNRRELGKWPCSASIRACWQCGACSAPDPLLVFTPPNSPVCLTS